MPLFSHELARTEPIRTEVDLHVELPTICDLANAFLVSTSLAPEEADSCDQALALLLKNTCGSLKIEVSERLAHVSMGPQRTVRLLAYDTLPAIAVPVLRYSPLLSIGDLVKISRLRSRRGFSGKHLRAIAARRELDGQVTDILTSRGTSDVLAVLAENDTARFSLLGQCRMAMRSTRKRGRSIGQAA